MKRHSSAASLALAALAVIGFTGSAAAEEQVRFRGNLEGVHTATPLDPPFVSALQIGTGNATHLGMFTFSIPHIVNTATMTATGSYHLRAENGDTVSADFSGKATLTDTPGVLSVVERATITGGTGRFAGATGSFIAERLVNPGAGWTVGSFKGTISSPGAGNP